jgi:hypothetical protein
MVVVIRFRGFSVGVTQFSLEFIKFYYSLPLRIIVSLCVSLISFILNFHKTHKIETTQTQREAEPDKLRSLLLTVLSIQSSQVVSPKHPTMMMLRSISKMWGNVTFAVLCRLYSVA